jgi:ketosteroid isomerase-like protein
VVVVENPIHFTDGPARMTARFGAARAGQYQPFRTLTESGIPLAIGSDGPMNPFLNLLFATTHPDTPHEALTREAAVRAYTRGSAFAEHAEREKGTLARGMLADLTVLSQDIFEVSTDALPATVSGLTIVGGKIAFDAGVLSAGRAAGATRRQSGVSARDSAALVALELRVEDAVVRRDTTFLRGVYASDFRFKHATGEVDDHAGWLAAVREARYTLRAPDSLDVEVHGDVALLTGRLHVRAEADEPQWREYTVRYARVYARRSGRWRLLTHHSTALTFGPPG